MPLHKRFSKQLTHRDSKYETVPVVGVDGITEISLVNEARSRTGHPTAIKFSELIEQSLATGDLKQIVHESNGIILEDKLVVTLRAGTDREKDYVFRIDGYGDGTPETASEALDKIAADVSTRINEMQAYKVFGDLGPLR